MKLIIHRGTKEIGGSCVEFKTVNNRILLDFGIPLVSRTRQPFDVNQLKDKTIQKLRTEGILPDIKGLYKDEQKDIDGILISHSHLDHYGFLQYVNPEIPIYLSKGAGILIDVSNIFIPTKVGKLNTRIISHKKQFNIGDFTIMPFLVDHSAFDALAFLIEAGGKKLFYSGDFRGHGRKSALFRQMVYRPPKNIDCLLMEGSTLGRAEKICNDEKEVEERIVQILRKKKNITFLFASSQNIDRLVSAYKACRRTDSIFVIDIYTAFILDKLGTFSKHIPQFNWRNVRVKYLKNHARALEKAGRKDLFFKYNKRKIKIPELNQKKNDILMLARNNSFFPVLLKGLNNPEGATIIYSMWEGYLSEQFRAFCREKELVIEYVHTSGHAALEDLRLFSRALNPKTLIPIHTFEGKSFPKLFKNVKILCDGETLTL